MKQLMSMGCFTSGYPIWMVMPQRRLVSELWTWEREYCLIRAASWCIKFHD
jgi:hypothetical protein